MEKQFASQLDVLEYIIKKGWLTEIKYEVDGWNSQGFNGYDLTHDCKVEGLEIPEKELMSLSEGEHTEVNFEFNNKEPHNYELCITIPEDEDEEEIYIDSETKKIAYLLFEDADVIYTITENEDKIVLSPSFELDI